MDEHSEQTLRFTSSNRCDRGTRRAVFCVLTILWLLWSSRRLPDDTPNHFFCLSQHLTQVQSVSVRREQKITVDHLLQSDFRSAPNASSRHVCASVERCI